MFADQARKSADVMAPGHDGRPNPRSTYTELWMPEVLAPPTVVCAPMVDRADVVHSHSAMTELHMSNPMPGTPSQMFDDIEWYCGNVPKGPFPHHHDDLRDLLLARVIFEAASRLSNASLKEQTTRIAGEIFQAGARNLVR